ncbi:hypothetical protein AAC387_Pa02g0508 [Persea americana]
MAATSFSHTSFIRRVQVCRGSKKAVPHSSEFLGRSLKKSDSNNGSPTPKICKIVAEVDEKKQTSKDRWKGLAFDASDDQQDIVAPFASTESFCLEEEAAEEVQAD